MTVIEKLKLKLQGLQKKRTEDEVGLLGMYMYCTGSGNFVTNRTGVLPQGY